MKYCYFNGNIVPEEEAHVSIFDMGMLRGYGVYEGIASNGGKVFEMEAHYKRFVGSASFLELSIPLEMKEFENKIEELLKKNNLDKGRAVIRVILTGGPAIGGIDFDRETPTFYITVEPFVPLPPYTYTDGALIITHTYERQYPEYKTVNYITASKLQRSRKKRGAIDILFISQDGLVLESATSNIFMVKDGVLITPDRGVLSGITRLVIIKLAKQAGIKVEERAVTFAELKQADEVFISSSWKDIVPVTRIDDIKAGQVLIIGSGTGSDQVGQVGPLTKKLIDIFEKYFIKSTVGNKIA